MMYYTVVCMQGNRPAAGPPETHTNAHTYAHPWGE